MFNDTHVGTVHINCRNLDNSIYFYTHWLGFTAYKKDKHATIVAVAEKPLIILHEIDEDAPESNILESIGIKLSSIEQLSQLFNFLVAKRYPIEDALDYGDFIGFNVIDPEGNRLIFYSNFSTPKPTEINGKPFDYQILTSLSHVPLSKIDDNTEIGFIHLNIPYEERYINFFVDGLGFDIRDSSSKLMWLHTGQYHHHIGLHLQSTQDNYQMLDINTEYSGLKYFEIRFVDEEDFQSFERFITDSHYQLIQEDQSTLIQLIPQLKCKVLYKNN